MALLKCLFLFARLVFDYVVDFLFHLYYRNSTARVSPVRDPILKLSASEMAQKIRSGELKSVDVVKAHIERINEVNPLLNALVDQRFDRALKEAAKIDADIAEGRADFEEKFLLGVPFTSKESNHAEGLRITYGLIPRREILAEEDADIIKFMKASGAIMLGGTNVPQVNLWWETHNPVYGITRNPHDVTRTAGGSAGGESALIAAGASPIGVGTDMGGSTRISAFMCGVFGHKCSNGYTATKGMTYRNGSEAEYTMSAVGPITRTADDLTVGIKAMVGPRHKELDLDRPVDLKKLKFYYMLRNGDPKCSTVRGGTIEGIKKVAKHFEKYGEVKEVKFEDFKHTSLLFKYWLAQEMNFEHDVTDRKGKLVWYSELVKWLRGKSELTFASIMLLFGDQATKMPPRGWTKIITDRLQSEINDVLGDDGVLFFPTAPTGVHHHHVSYFRSFNLSYCSIFNVLKLPVTQAPIGVDKSNLPTGVQIVAAHKLDRLCVAVAKEIEKAFGGYVKP